MADATVDAAIEPPKRGRKALILNVIIVLVLAGAGFAVTYLGLLQGLVGGSGQHESHDAAPAFVAIEPMAIVIPGTPPRQFRLSAQIEVAPDQIAAVQGMMPRVQNVLQGFLRAVEPDRLADRAAWFELRLQMLYRIRMVLGEDRVRDLLITDFIVN